MKFNKYLLFILLITMLTAPINDVLADNGSNNNYSSANCYYIGNETGFSGYIVFGPGFRSGEISGTLHSMRLDYKSEHTTFTIENINESWDYWGKGEVPARPVDIMAIKNNYNNCPKYLFGSYGWEFAAGSSDNVAAITDDKSTAIYGYENQTNGDFWATLVTEQQYWNGMDLCPTGQCEIGENVELTCENYEELFGDPNDAGGIDINGKETPPSLAYIINEIFKYLRIIVILLIILLGTIDIAKAVIAGKEDEIKKSQSALVKRVILGVAVFLTPVFVRIVMNLADIVWTSSDPNESYTSCTLETIVK